MSIGIFLPWLFLHSREVISHKVGSSGKSENKSTKKFQLNNFSDYFTDTRVEWHVAD